MRRLSEGVLSRKDNPKAEMPFLDHLEELRWRILWSVIAVVLGAVIGLFLILYFDVVTLLIRPAHQIFGESFRLIVLAPEDTFFVLLQLCLATGLVLASPVVVAQAWRFFGPALEDRERRALIPAFVMGLFLFMAGVALAYFIALPLTLRFLTGILTDIFTPDWTATGYLGFVVKLLLAFGVLFELPVVVLLLSVLGIVTPEFLRSKRRHAVVAILIVASFLSPGDMINVTLLMTIPLLALYEFSIWLCVITWRRRKREEQGSENGNPASGEAPAQTPAPDAAVAQPTPYDHGDPARKGDGGQ